MRHFVLMAVDERHHAVFRGQLEFLNPFGFQFLFGSKVQLMAEGFQLVFELQVFLVELPQFLVMSRKLLDQRFLSVFHESLLPDLRRLI
jgi:hypothetical protein